VHVGSPRTVWTESNADAITAAVKQELWRSLRVNLSEFFAFGGYLFSIGLAPGDFFVFSKVKTALKGRTFHDVQGM